MKPSIAFALGCLAWLVVTLGAVNSATAAGGPGNALHFTDSFQYVSVPHTNVLNAYPITVTAWFQVLSPGPMFDLVSKYDGSASGWRIQIFNGNLRSQYSASSANFVANGLGLFGGPVTDGLWHHVALTVDATGGKFYLDGALISSRVWTGAPGAPTNNINEMRMGGTIGVSGSVDVALDEVMVWNVALTQAQIQAYKNRSLTGNESGLVAYYHCDEGSGTTTADSAPAGGANDGSFSDVLFTSSGIAPFTPYVETLGADFLAGPTSPTLSGVANPEGANTSAWFEWGTTTNYGNVTPAQPLGSGLGNTNFSRVLGGLTGGLTYHFRAVATNADGIGFGTDRSFTPLATDTNTGWVVLFSDNFNADSSSSWTVNAAPTANASKQSATFAFDYSPFGIPPAPGSTDTLGLRLRSNIPIVSGVEVTSRPAGVTSGLSVSPTGRNFGSSYHLSFYAWVNFNGAPNPSGLADNANSEGGTHNVLFAVGTSGTVPLVVGNTSLVANGQMDGIAFATTGDGGISSDYRMYPASGTFAVPATGVYAAGTDSTANQNVNAYYASIPSLAAHTAPAVQLTLSTAEYGSDAANTQDGLTQAGSFGFAWHKVDITKSNNIVRWTIDDVAITTFDGSALSLGGNNIAIGDSDVNSTTTRHPSLLFTLIDNLVVTGFVTGLPVAIQFGFSNGTLHLSWPEASAGGAVPQYADSLAPPVLWSNVVATATTNSGIVSISVPATNAQRFFRLKQ